MLMRVPHRGGSDRNCPPPISAPQVSVHPDELFETERWRKGPAWCAQYRRSWSWNSAARSRARNTSPLNRGRDQPRELAGYFADDGIYHNIPLAPVAGKKEIENFTSKWIEINWDILNIISKDNIVISERLDRTKMEGGKFVDLPVTGVFELKNGEIKIWRDYFDLGTYLKALE